MPTSLISFVVAVTLVFQSVPAAGQFNNSSIPIEYEATVLESNNGMCPTAEEMQNVQDKIRFDVRNQLGIRTYTCGGTSGWDRIAYLNMNDSSHQCPGDFREVTFDGIRLCARDNSSDTNQRVCTSITFSSNDIPYTEVCGRVIGYQYGQAFGLWYSTPTIDEYYADGVTLTHGPVGAREHIWTFVTGLQESANLNIGNNAQFVCPCAIDPHPSIVVPSFIGDDYFCESGTHGNYGFNVFHNDDPLWDGDECPEGNSCCTFSNPPYFTKQLPASTSDDIELRDCGYWNGIGYSAASDTLIQFIELYIK